MPKNLSQRSALFRLLRYGVLSVGHGLVVLEVDDVAVEMLGHPRDRLVGQRLTALGFDPDGVTALQSEMQRVGSVVEQPIAFQSAAGSRTLRVTALQSLADTSAWSMAIRQRDPVVTDAAQTHETIDHLRSLAPILEACGLGMGVFDNRREVLFETESWTNVRENQVAVEREASGIGTRRPRDAIQRTVRTDDGGVYDVVEAELHKNFNIGLAWDATELWQAYETIREQAEELKRLNEEIRDLAMRDGLTGIYNRRYLEERIEVELERALRYDTELAVIFFDVDDFKPYNDTYGHVAGDYVLRTLAELISARLRRTDVMARYGGEEFAILLPETPLKRAVTLARSLGKVVAGHDWKHRGITISLGVSCVHADDDALAFMDRVDRAMYAAKRSGRNQLIVTDPTQ